MKRADPSQRRDLIEICGTTEFPNPYGMLEDETRRVLEWQRNRNVETRHAIAAIGPLKGLSDVLGRHLEACLIAAPKRGGERWFWHERSVEGTGAALLVSNGLTQRRRPLFRAARVQDDHATIDWYSPSPDGRWVAVGISADGDEQSALHLIDADTGSVVPPRLLHASGGRVAWLPDSRGLYCCAGLARDTESPAKALFFVRPGVPGPERIVTPTRDLDEHVLVQVSPDARHVGLAANPWCPRLCFVLDRTSESWHEAFPSDDGEVFHGVFAAGRYVAITTRNAPKGRVISAPIDSLTDSSRWIELIPEGVGVIRAIASGGPWLSVLDHVDGGFQLRLIRADGSERNSVDLPTPGAFGSRLDWAQVGTDPPVEMTSNEIVFTYSTSSVAPALYRFDTAARKLQRLSGPLRRPIGVCAESRTCQSSDGYEVPFDVIRSSECRSASPAPTLIAAYGGWNTLWQARGYPAMFTPFIEAGGTFIFAHLRGDGTLGADHWRGGRLDCKQRTFDDLYAVAEQLIAERATTPDRLGLYGASNGGLLGGVAITQRPDLFRAVVALVPLFDMCRARRERFAELYSWEYGDPRLPEQAAWIREYSPYHNIQPGVDRPATMIVCGSRDIRTHAWHGRKMTAALRAANQNGRPIHLRVHEGRGHFTAATHAPPQIIAEWLGFLMRELGLPLPGEHTGATGPVVGVSVGTS